jgi:hypothetical protein
MSSWNIFFQKVMVEERIQLPPHHPLTSTNSTFFQIFNNDFNLGLYFLLHVCMEQFRDQYRDFKSFLGKSGKLKISGIKDKYYAKNVNDNLQEAPNLVERKRHF